MVSLGFLATSLIVIIIPGTGVIYTVTTSLSGNKRSAFLAAFGCTLGILPHILAAILGISVILNTGAQIFKIIRIIGVLYLIYLGIGLLKAENGIKIGEKKKERPFLIITKAILINLLNPKLTLFFLSFLPQFIEPDSLNTRIEMISLSLVFMGLTFIIFCSYGLLANSFRSVLIKSPKLFNRIQQGFGIILIGFAGKIALDR